MRCKLMRYMFVNIRGEILKKLTHSFLLCEAMFLAL